MYIIIYFDNGKTEVFKDEAKEILDVIKATTQTKILMNNDGSIQMMQPNSCFINIPSNGYFINLNHVTMISVYDDEPKKEEEKHTCMNCKHGDQPYQEDPCNYCYGNSQWEAEDDKN